MARCGQHRVIRQAFYRTYHDLAMTLDPSMRVQPFYAVAAFANSEVKFRSETTPPEHGISSNRFHKTVHRSWKLAGCRRDGPGDSADNRLRGHWAGITGAVGRSCMAPEDAPKGLESEEPQAEPDDYQQSGRLQDKTAIYSTE